MLTPAEIRDMNIAAQDQAITGVHPALHLARAVEAATLATVTPLVQQLSEWKEGDRVTGDFHHGQAATITKVFVGFHYELDEPHDLGPRHGTIKSGTVYDTSGWRKLPVASDAAAQPAQAGADRAGG
ncbi:hypothetical protein LJR066_002784 [Acidovorax sp. LjRoot66]|uniref:hypothetical protein n=1 Tax=Acidovorax sp. LjRoot66 TaxID=3342334 RepID=UPI003ECE59D6